LHSYISGWIVDTECCKYFSTFPTIGPCAYPLIAHLGVPLQFAFCGAEWTGASMSKNTLEVFALNVHLVNYEFPYLYSSCETLSSVLRPQLFCASIFHSLEGLALMVFLSLCKLYKPGVFVLPYPCQLHKLTWGDLHIAQRRCL